MTALLRLLRRRPRGALAVAAVVATVAAFALLQALAPTRADVEVRHGGPLAAVAVDLPAGDLRLAAGVDTDVSGRARMRYFAVRPSLAAVRRDGALRLTATCRWWTTCTVDLDLRVPSAARLDARTAFGDVRADGIAGDAVLEAPSGSVRARGLAAGRFEALTGSGAVRLHFGRAPRDVSVETAAGDVELVLPAAPYRIVTETDAGRVVLQGLRHAPASARGVRVETTSGDILIRAEGASEPEDARAASKPAG